MRSLLLPLSLAALLMGCGPAVLQVEPTSAAPGEVITIYGTAFGPDASARLGRDSGAIQLAVLDASSDRLTARLPGATPAGVYDVVVETGGEIASLEGALTVVAGRTTIRFIDVGQGDATLIVGADGQRLLIDGGPAGATAALEEAVAEVGGVDHVAVTHTDADHLAGVVDLLAGDDGVAGTADDVVPGTRWIGHDDGVCDSNLCNRFRALRADFDRPLVGDALDLGGAIVEVVGRDGDFGDAGTATVADVNERSLALVVSFAGRRVFIGGDLTGGGLGSADVEGLAAEVIGPVDVLRVNHHGSATSTSTGFVDALQPAVAIISAGTDNAFCHPEPGVLGRLAAAGPSIVATGRGMDQDADRCGGPTAWPAGSRVGVGTIEVIIEADGTLTVDGEAF